MNEWFLAAPLFDTIREQFYVRKKDDAVVAFNGRYYVEDLSAAAAKTRYKIFAKVGAEQQARVEALYQLAIV